MGYISPSVCVFPSLPPSARFIFPSAKYIFLSARYIFSSIIFLSLLLSATYILSYILPSSLPSARYIFSSIVASLPSVAYIFLSLPSEAYIFPSLPSATSAPSAVCVSLPSPSPSPSPPAMNRGSRAAATPRSRRLVCRRAANELTVAHPSPLSPGTGSDR